MSTLSEACRTGDASAARRLIEQGGDIESKAGTLGRHHLAVAAACGNVECVKVLLQAGANKEARDLVDESALHLATTNGHAECARLLLEAGANKDARNFYLWTPLHFAVDGDHRECVKVLLHAGANTNALTDDDKSPLNFAHGSSMRSFLKSWGAKEMIADTEMVPCGDPSHSRYGDNGDISDEEVEMWRWEEPSDDLSDDGGDRVCHDCGEGEGEGEGEEDGQTLLVCDSCPRAFHLKCLANGGGTHWHWHCQWRTSSQAHWHCPLCTRSEVTSVDSVSLTVQKKLRAVEAQLEAKEKEKNEAEVAVKEAQAKGGVHLKSIPVFQQEMKECLTTFRTRRPSARILSSSSPF